METVEISRVECTPETTTLYMEAYNRKGYWIQLDSVLHLRGAVTGLDYPLRRCEGVALGQHVYMPDSGNVSYRWMAVILRSTSWKEEKAVDSSKA